MGTDNLARGMSNFPGLPNFGHGSGIATSYGTLLPPGTRVAGYVRSAAKDYDDPTIAKIRRPTLDEALKRCRANAGDVVYMLPGHSESFTTATILSNLKAGTKVVGYGEGTDMPTLRLTANAAQFAISVANVSFSGIKFRLEGDTGITKAILVTGASCRFENCVFEVASGANNKAAIALEVGAGGNDFKFLNNYVYGTETHNVTDGIKVVAAVTDLVIANNLMQASATAANGLVHITAAALRCSLVNNTIFNTHTASTGCIVVDNVAASGVIANCYCATVNNGVATAQGIILGAAALFRGFQSFSSDEPIKSGVLTPTVVAT